MSTIQKLIEFISTKDKKSNNNKSGTFSLPSTKHNKDNTDTFKYLLSIRTSKNKDTGFRDYKELSFKELDKYTDNVKKFEAKYGVMYEYIINDCKYYHIFFDIDSFTNVSEFDPFIKILHMLESPLGPFTLGGYTSDKKLSKRTGLQYIKDAKKVISLHVCYYATCISREDYDYLTNPALNKLAVKEGDGLKLGPLTQTIDKSIYSFIRNERCMRIPISNKDTEGKKVNTAGTVITWSEDDDDWVLTNVSDNLITCKGDEEIITLCDLYRLKMFEPTDAATNMGTPDVDPKHPNLNKLKTTKVSTPSDKEEYNPERSLRKDILAKLTDENGDKDIELGQWVSCVITSACRERETEETLTTELYNWWNTDAEGNEDKHKSDNAMTQYVHSYYNKPDTKYADVPPEVYLRALVKRIPEEGIRKFLYKRITDTFTSITLSDNKDYHDFSKIIYHSEDEIRVKDTIENKAKLLCECTRYDPIKGVVYMFMQENYALTRMDITHYKTKYLPALVGNKEAPKYYNTIIYYTSLKGIPRIKLTDIHKCNPLDNVKDELPKTKEQDINNWKKFLHHVFKLYDNTNDDETTNDILDYINKWIAVMIQEPGAYEVAIILLYGLQGTGKTLLNKVCAFLLYDKHTVNFNKQSEQFMDSVYTGYQDTIEDHIANFNSKVAYRIFSGVQELDDTKDNVSTTTMTANLKRLTDPSKRITYKGKDSYDTQNITQIMISTNSDKPIPIEHTERRYLAVSTNKSHAADRQYWAKYYKMFSAPYFIKHVYDYYKNDVDITDFNLVTIPRTQMLIKMMASTMSTVNRFVCINYNECVRGLKYSQFVKLIKNDESLLGKYSSPRRLWEDYVNLYNCDNEDGIYYPDFGCLQKIEDIHDLFSKMYHENKIKPELPVDIDDDDEELDEDAKAEIKLSKLIKSITHTSELKRNNYTYVLNTEIPKEHKQEIIDMLLADGYKPDKNITHNGKRTASGYKKLL